MVRRHQFPVYLTLTKSCIYARNHTLRTWWCAGISFHRTSHSPNDAYMHEIIHLEPHPLLGKSNQEKRVYQKLQKGLKSIFLLREFAKEKNTSKNTNAGHQFQVYLTLTKTCIYARNHTLRTHPAYLEKATSQKKRVYQKLQKGLNSILFLRKFGKEKTTSKNKNSPKLQTRYKPILFWKEFGKEKATTV